MDNWLTAVRLRRLSEVLTAVRTHPPPGVPEQRVHRVAWSRCHGPLADVAALIDVLVGARLLEHRGSLTRLTRRGHRVATQDHQQGGRLLVRSLIDAGYFRNQARMLLASGDFTVSGNLVCKRSHALGVAAQLTGALRRWTDVVLDSHLRVPATLVEELLATWALQPIPRRPDEEARQEIGDRAEAYSYQLERERAGDPSRVQWVALDDDALGYDIKNAATSPERCIEVKGSQGPEVRFFLSSNEWEVGHRLVEAYEIHFWGGISLTRPRATEYRQLREQGYPLVFRNLPRVLESGQLIGTPSQYLITKVGRDE
jgi:hypothetical protein